MKTSEVLVGIDISKARLDVGALIRKMMPDLPTRLTQARTASI